MFHSIFVKQLCLAVMATAALLGAHVGAHAQAGDAAASASADEQQIFELTNLARAGEGLGLLKWDPALAAAAAQHTQRMRGEPSLSHAYPGEPPLLDRAAQAGAHFSSVAENIAVGPSAGALEREWLHSPPHRANILDPRMDSIGISVMRRGGDLYATQDLSHAVSLVAPQQVEGQVGSLLQQQGLTLQRDANFVRDARESCEMKTGSSGGTQPRFLMRWEGASLSALPAQLSQRIQSGGYSTAAVGTCTSSNPQQGFTVYRVAVLLY